MTDYHWPTIRDHAIRAFRGELINQDTENAIVEVFELFPTVVVKAIDDVAEDVASGKARSGWAVVRARVVNAHRPAAEITVHGEDRETQVRQAERYIHTAGIHYDRWEGELEDELFGDRGRLHQWAADIHLHARLESLWQHHRPRGSEIHEAQQEDAHRRLQARAARSQLTAEERERQHTEATATIQALIDQRDQPDPDDIPF